MLYFSISFKEKNHHFLLQTFQLRKGITNGLNQYFTNLMFFKPAAFLVSILRI